MRKKLRKLLKGSGGFTLLELIVVITLMGFLIAILAPRLANMTDAGVDMQCDSNKQRLSEIVSTFITQNNRLPDGLLTLAIKDTDGEWTISSDDGNPKNGPEFLSREMAENNNLGVLDLSTGDDAAAIIADLVDMGISEVYYYQQTDSNDPDGKWVLKEPVSLVSDSGPVTTADVGLAIVGAATSDTSPAYDATFAYGTAAKRAYSHPGLIGRILLGVHPECELVENGMIANAGVYADAQRKTEYYKYAYYTIIMPRLEAQAADLEGAKVEAFFDANDDGEKTTGERIITIDEWPAEEIWDYYIMCPEGHKFHMSVDGEHLYVIKGEETEPENP